MALQYQLNSDGNSYIVAPGSCGAGNISIPDTTNGGNGVKPVTRIGAYAFYTCDTVTSINITNNVTGIDDAAFANSSGLASVILPNNLNGINRNIFQNCFNLLNITLPSTVTYIGNDAFYRCKNLSQVIMSNIVTGIGLQAFRLCSGLTGITIPNSVTTIGTSAFVSCSSLSGITIPNSVTGIDGNIFWDCSNLTGIEVKESNQYYCNDEHGVLFNKNKTTIISYPNGNQEIYYAIPNSVTSIGQNAFDRSSNLSGITIPDSVTSIELDAFRLCSGLTGITIPNSVTTIGDGAFLGCDTIKSVAIPNQITVIKSYTFGNCYNLTGITMPDSVTSINTGAFYNCTNLNNFTMPTGLTRIEEAAFGQCSSLTSVTIPNGVTSIERQAFEGCSSLTSFTIPNSVTSIGAAALQSCSSLTSFTIPNSIETIENYMFRNCTNLTSVTISASVKSIGIEAFIDCTNLKTINFLGNAPTLGSNVFFNTHPNLKIYRYSKKSGWSSTLGGKDVLLIDSPIHQGLQTFGFPTASSGKISVPKQNKNSTYRQNLSKQIDSTIANLTANDLTKSIFRVMAPDGNCCFGDNSTDPIDPFFVRSSTCWAKNIDTSPISVWNNGGGYPAPEDAGGGGGAGTLISPRHIVFCNHFQIKIGKKLIFVDMQNNSYIRTLTNSLRVGDTDIRIGLLDSDLPSSVSFCKVASFDLVKVTSSNNRIPVLYVDQEKKALVGDYFNSNSSGRLIEPIDPKRANFYELPTVGDSGNPINFVYNNKIILLFSFTSETSGDNISYNIDAINSVMTTLGGGYTLSIFNKEDISGLGKIQIEKSNFIKELIPFQIGNQVYPDNVYTFVSAIENSLAKVFNPNLFNTAYGDILNITIPANENENENELSFFFDGTNWIYSDFQTNANDYVIPNDSIIKIQTDNITKIPVNRITGVIIIHGVNPKHPTPTSTPTETPTETPTATETPTSTPPLCDGGEALGPLPDNLTITFNNTTACTRNGCYGQVPPVFTVTRNVQVGQCYWSYNDEAWDLEVDFDDISHKFYVDLYWRNSSWPGFCGSCDAFHNLTAISNSTTVSNSKNCNPSDVCPSLGGGTATITW